MTPEKNCWGARAVKVPTVSGVQESLQIMPIVLPSKKSKNKGPVFYGADDAWKFRCRRGLAIIWGAPSLILYTLSFSRIELQVLWEYL